MPVFSLGSLGSIARTVMLATRGRAVDKQVVASDPVFSPQGSLQQLTVHPDPRIPEELCESEESSVSPHPPLPPTPSLRSAREGWTPRQFLFPNVTESLKSLNLSSAASSPILGFLALFFF